LRDKEYIIFCDESDSRGKYYSNFYGGLVVGSSKYQLLTNQLNELKHQLHFFCEIKWEKVTERYLDKYITLIEHFFREVKHKNIKIRIMFTHNTMVSKSELAIRGDLKYFKLYYQFIKHAFGLSYIPYSDEGTLVRLFFDVFPHKKERAEQFKGFLLGLQENQWFKAANIKLSKSEIAEVKSHDHVLLQCLDIVLGSMNFKLNDKNKEKLPGSNRRGKKTIAKEKLYKVILKEIQAIKPNFNIGISTSVKGDKSNRWQSPHLHWCFTAEDSEFDSRFVKK
jgi:hypothetical protein